MLASLAVCLRGIEQFSGFKIDVYEQCLWNFVNNAFETTKFWFTIDLTAILRLLKTPLVLDCSLIVLLLREKGLSPESCFESAHPRADCLYYKKKNECNGFLINAGLLNVYFIQHYHSTYFFIKKFIFSNVYISVNTKYDIRMYLYVFWLRKAPSIKCVPNWWGDWGGGHPKCVKLRIGGGSVIPHVYLRTYTISFHVFGSIFVL